MKTIKFRAKAAVNNKHSNIKVGDWVYGCFIESGCDVPCIIFGDGEQVEIDRETLGQFVGKDDDDKEIYVGDIIEFTDQEDQSNESNGTYFEEVPNRGVVHWDDADYCFDVTNRECDRVDAFYEVSVIGNYHDNKELLETN